MSSYYGDDTESGQPRRRLNPKSTKVDEPQRRRSGVEMTPAVENVAKTLRCIGIAAAIALLGVGVGLVIYFALTPAVAVGATVAPTPAPTAAPTATEAPAALVVEPLTTTATPTWSPTQPPERLGVTAPAPRVNVDGVCNRRLSGIDSEFCIAVFGYSTNESHAIPIGVNNLLSPTLTLMPEHPTHFSGSHFGAYYVRWWCHRHPSITWTLGADDGSVSSATLTAAERACPPVPTH